MNQEECTLCCFSSKDMHSFETKNNKQPVSHFDYMYSDFTAYCNIKKKKHNIWATQRLMLSNRVHTST